MAVAQMLGWQSSSLLTAAPGAPLLDAIEAMRLAVGLTLDASTQATFGQYFTPASVARLMSGMFPQRAAAALHLLDPGAGMGMLSAAWVESVCNWSSPPSDLVVTAYEIDPMLIPHLKQTFSLCAMECERRGIAFQGRIRALDFIADTVPLLDGDLFAIPMERYDCAIINPPYSKMHRASTERALLRSIGVETSNLYTGFLTLAMRLLRDGGDLVTITPRSFCNGRYFRPFREELLSTMALNQAHIFASRTEAFRDDAVLQETVIIHAVRCATQPDTVTVSESAGPEDEDLSIHSMPFARVVHPDDAERTLHLVSTALGQQVADRMRLCTTPLTDLGLTVSTGRVVDFRATTHLRDTPEAGTVPLIYPEHCIKGAIVWPRAGGKKAQAIVDTAASASLLVPAGVYVLVKRFSAKEERRRIVASVYEPEGMPGERVGIENHINYYHCAAAGLQRTLAVGLATFLNSTIVDEYFRQWSGSTQVNATDLRKMRYPSMETLASLGARSVLGMDQQQIDALVEQEVFGMAESTGGADPVDAKRKTEQALMIIRALGFPREQQNERSALTLLTLLGLRPGMPWSAVTAPLLGVRPMMDLFRDHYGKSYAENSRETVRKKTLHQFVEWGLVRLNPDQRLRATNSPHSKYQIDPSALELLRVYDTPAWAVALATYLSTRPTLISTYAQERAMDRIPLVLNGDALSLSPGGQNVLIKEIIDEFCPRFTPGGRTLYIGDSETKWSYYDRDTMAILGVVVEEHGKMPDVIVYDAGRNWLLLIEAVTSHGPVDAKRRSELAHIFASSKAPLVYVTTFRTRKAMVKYLSTIAWETEVWVSEAPTHMIHFNGARFLGPHPDQTS